MRKYTFVNVRANHTRWTSNVLFYSNKFGLHILEFFSPDENIVKSVDTRTIRIVHISMWSDDRQIVLLLSYFLYEKTILLYRFVLIIWGKFFSVKMVPPFHQKFYYFLKLIFGTQDFYNQYETSPYKSRCSWNKNVLCLLIVPEATTPEHIRDTRSTHDTD